MQLFEQQRLERERDMILSQQIQLQHSQVTSQTSLASNIDSQSSNQNISSHGPPPMTPGVNTQFGITKTGSVCKNCIRKGSRCQQHI